MSKLVKRLAKKLCITDLTEHFIEVTNPKPIEVPHRRTSPEMLEVMKNIVDQYLEENIIEPCKSSWSSTPIVVKKANRT